MNVILRMYFNQIDFIIVPVAELKGFIFHFSIINTSKTTFKATNFVLIELYVKAGSSRNARVFNFIF